MSKHNTRAAGKDDVIVLDETSKVLGTLLKMIGSLEFPNWFYWSL
jgi:hypothetical protein